MLDVSVAATLQNMLSRLLDPEVEGSNHPSEHLLDAFRRQLPPVNAGLNKDNLMSMSETSISYEDLFFILAQECIEMLTVRFGELGCDQLEHGRSRYFARSLGRDPSTMMFDSLLPTSDGYAGGPDESGGSTTETINPLREYNNHTTIQMLEIWFSQHPFSFILSKTLLLRDIRHDTHSELLLAAMLADVQRGQDGQDADAKGENLFRWATAQLHEQSQEHINLTTIQAVLLLGWRSLCSSQARRAICYFIWASYAIQTVPTPQLGHNTINGIDVGEIESECTCNLHWLIFSINLWAMMQVDSPGCSLPSASAPITFPAAEESASANLKLDRTSYNISTLQNQERMFRDLWLLSHVSATVSHIHALYPSSPTLEIEDEDPSWWQSHTLRQLQHLSSPPQDISLVCRNVRHVLLGAVQRVEARANHSNAHALALSASHTMMIIHFLVPSPMSIFPISGQTSRILAAGGIEQLVSDFCYSVTALLKVLSTLHDRDREGANTDRAVMSPRRPSSIIDIFALALDACGRGLNSLFSIGQTGSEQEQKCIGDRKPELARLANELHACSDLSLLSNFRLRTAKKQLETALSQFLDLHFDFSSLASGLETSRGNSIPTAGTLSSASSAAAVNTNDTMASYAGDFANLDSLEAKYSNRFFGYGFPFMGDGCEDAGRAS